MKLRLETSVEKLHKDLIITDEAYTVCMAAGLHTLLDLMRVDLDQIRALNGCGRTVAAEIEMLRSSDVPLLHPALPTSKSINVRLSLALALLNRLSTPAHLDMLTWIQTNFQRLRTRTQNVLTDNFGRSLHDIVTIAYQSATFDPLRCTGCGSSSAEELSQFIKRFRNLFELETAHIDVARTEPNPCSYKTVECLRHRYNFLSDDELVDVAQHTARTGKEPYLFVARRFVATSKMRGMQVCRDYYGFNEERRRHTRREIAERENYTTERVRQIVTGGIPVPPLITRAVETEIAPKIGHLKSFDDPMWLQLQTEHMLHETGPETAMLVCAILPNHHRLSINREDKFYVAANSLVQGVSVRNICNELCQRISMRHQHTVTVNVMEVLMKRPEADAQKMQILCPVYMDFLCRRYDNVSPLDHCTLEVQPGRINVTTAVEQILDQHADQMTLEEIGLRYRQLFPEHAHITDDNLRSAIVCNPNIIAKGQRSTYVHKAHSHAHFTGTLSDYLEHLLRQAQQPMPLSTLVEKAQQEFGGTNRNSINTLLRGERRARFAFYEGHRVGLAELSHLHTHLKPAPDVHRYDFDTRLAHYRSFVDKHQRFPSSRKDASEEERSLARWQCNVDKGSHVTTEQRQRLQDLRTELSHLPQTGDEYNFLMRCRQLLQYVTDNKCMPRVSDEPALYTWFVNNRRMPERYPDNRTRYFNQLIHDLTAAGHAV